MNQSSSPRSHLKGLSTHEIHDDVVTALDSKAVASSRVTHYLREAKLGTAEVALDPESNSSHLDDSERAIMADRKKSRFRPCENLPEPSMSHALPSIIERRLTKSLAFGRRLLRWVLD
jgi:hypothetical protein